MIFRGVDSALSCAYVNSTYKEQFTTEAQRTQRLFNKIESRHPRRKGEHWIFIQALDPSLCTLCLCGANAGFRIIGLNPSFPRKRELVAANSRGAALDPASARVTVTCSNVNGYFRLNSERWVCS